MSSKRKIETRNEIQEEQGQIGMRSNRKIENRHEIQEENRK